MILKKSYLSVLYNSLNSLNSHGFKLTFIVSNSVLYLVYLKHVEWDTAIGHLLSNFNQMFLNVLYDGVPVLVWKNLTNHITRWKGKISCKPQPYSKRIYSGLRLLLLIHCCLYKWRMGIICSSVHWLATLLGKVTPVSAHNVQAFELLFGGVFAISLRLNHQCCVFLLLQQQKRLEHAIDVNLQEFIEFIHLAFHLHRQLLDWCWLQNSTSVRFIHALKILHSIVLWDVQKTPPHSFPNLPCFPI